MDELKNDVQSIKWCILCLSVIVISFIVVTTLVAANIEEMHNDKITELEARCEQLERKSAYYDEVMATYEFFNVHWTATMKGEE